MKMCRLYDAKEYDLYTKSGFVINKVQTIKECVEKEITNEAIMRFGWIDLGYDYCVILPYMYKRIEALIGEQELLKILQPNSAIEASKDEPFNGIGMIKFKQWFSKIIDFYKDKTHKEKQYLDIVRDRPLIFTSAIPVYNTYLSSDYKIIRENTDGIYDEMVRLSYWISKENISVYRLKKSKDELLFELQNLWIKLDEEFDRILPQLGEPELYIFSLSRMEYEMRDKYIGFTDELYTDKNKAVAWYENIIEKINSNTNPDNKFDIDEAVEELEDIYENIMESFEDDEEDENDEED